MKPKRLSRNFFARNTHTVARQLLGKILVRNFRNIVITGRITEVECYIGEEDLASHASRGRTPRTEIMYGQAGRAYVYMIYGMYDMLNIVTERKGYPAALLIRSLDAVSGPGRLTRALHITRTLNGEDVTDSTRLFVIDDSWSVDPRQIFTSPRIGVDYAGLSAQLPWRYYLRDSQFFLKK
jgi:DNA-3-methyladenine glycosylase